MQNIDFEKLLEEIRYKPAYEFERGTKLYDIITKYANNDTDAMIEIRNILKDLGIIDLPEVINMHEMMQNNANSIKEINDLQHGFSQYIKQYNDIYSIYDVAFGGNRFKCNADYK